MLSADRRVIGPDETSDEVERDLARLGARLLVSAIEAMLAGTLVEAAQDETRATYAPRLAREDGLVDWSAPAVRIHNLIRGLYPWPHAYSFLDGRRLILLRSTWSDGAPGAAAPGLIVEAGGGRLSVVTGDGTLHLGQVQVEGRRAASVREFLAGHHVTAGDRFDTR